MYLISLNNQFTSAYVETGAKDTTWKEHQGENGIGSLEEMSKS